MAKVLLVEDDNNLREIYEARLQAEGYDIVAARDGEEALVIAKREMPDLVISDVMMPKISGFEMLDILRNTEGLRKVKVIMLTALGQADDQHRADSLGADRYLVKSQVTLEDIVNAAQELLSNGQMPTQSAPAPEQPVATTAATSAEQATPAVAVEPIVTQEAEAPVLSQPAAAPPEPTVDEDDTPVIPLAAAPPEPTVDEDSDVMPQMPPTPASTIPEPATSDIPTAAAEQNNPIEAAPEAPSVTPITVISTDDSEPATPNEAPTQADEQNFDQPLSSSEEQADIEQQIANFVESQPGTAPAAVEPEARPTTSPTEEPAAPTAPAVPVAPETTIQPDTSIEAASTAIPAATPSEPSQPAVATENTTTPEQEQTLNEAVANLSGHDAEPATTQDPVTSEGVEPTNDEPVATQKVVIQPLVEQSDQPKKSLDELAAEEEAREKALQEFQANNDQKTTPSTNANGDFDPHSISL